MEKGGKAISITTKKTGLCRFGEQSNCVDSGAGGGKNLNAEGEHCHRRSPAVHLSEKAVRTGKKNHTIPREPQEEGEFEMVRKKRLAQARGGNHSSEAGKKEHALRGGGNTQTAKVVLKLNA